MEQEYFAMPFCYGFTRQQRMHKFALGSPKSLLRKFKIVGS
jgi:hypothetical protein